MAQRGDFRGGVFISYRRALAREQVFRLYEVLKQRLEASRVFIDERDGAIPKGAAFPPEIEQALECAHLVLIVIAPGWLEHIHDRAENPDVDWVLRETELALKRYSPEIPPKTHVLLLDGAVCPKASELPESIRFLPEINAYSFPDGWADNQDFLSPFLNEICARVPRKTMPLDDGRLQGLRKTCFPTVLEKLGRLPKIGRFGALRDQWESDFKFPAEFKVTKCLEEFRTCLQKLNDEKEVRRRGLDSDEIEYLRDDCVAIVDELFRLGACEIVSRLGTGQDTFGNYTMPAQLRGVETQVFALAHSQGKCGALIDFGCGRLIEADHFPVKGVVDRGTVISGVEDDEKCTLLKALWAEVPEFYDVKDGKKEIRYPSEFGSSSINSLSARLRAMGQDASSPRVTVAYQSDSGNKAHDLRVWFESMQFDVDVLVRSGRAATHIEREEGALLSAGWACLRQIEKIESGRKG